MWTLRWANMPSVPALVVDGREDVGLAGRGGRSRRRRARRRGRRAGSRGPARCVRGCRAAPSRARVYAAGERGDVARSAYGGRAMVFAIDGRGLAGAAARRRPLRPCCSRGAARLHPEDEYRVLETGRARDAPRAAAVRMALPASRGWRRSSAAPTRSGRPRPRPLAVGPAGRASCSRCTTARGRSAPATSPPTSASGIAWPGPARSLRRADRLLFDTATVRDDVVAAWGLDPAGAARGPRGRGPRAGGRRAAPGVGGRSCCGSARWSPARGPTCSAPPSRPRARDGLRRGAGRGRATGREAAALAGPGVARSGAVDDTVLRALLRVRSRSSRRRGARATASRRSRRSPTARRRSSATCRCSARRSGAARCACRSRSRAALAAALLRLEREPGLRGRWSPRRRPRPTWEAAAAVLHAALHEAAAGPQVSAASPWSRCCTAPRGARRAARLAGGHLGAHQLVVVDTGPDDGGAELARPPAPRSSRCPRTRASARPTTRASRAPATTSRCC